MKSLKINSLVVCWAGGGRGKEALQRCEVVGLEQKNTQISFFFLILVELPHFSCDISAILVMGTSTGEHWRVVVGVSSRGFMGVLECPLHPEQQSHFLKPEELL